MTGGVPGGVVRKGEPAVFTNQFKIATETAAGGVHVHEEGGVVREVEPAAFTNQFKMCI